MTYQCHNRAPFAPSIQVADGWETTWARRMVDMQFTMDPNCIYSTSDLGKADTNCSGCRWRINGQADTGTGVATGPVQVGDSLAGVCQVEGEPSGNAGTGDVERASAVAEQRRPSEQARAAEKLEAIYPGAAIYRQVKE